MVGGPARAKARADPIGKGRQNVTSETWTADTEENEEANNALVALRNNAASAPQSFADLAGDATVIPGRDLIAEKDELIGVPFIITSVAFRPDSKGGAAARDFVSVECVDINNRALVFNDGSTGIRRQVVAYLQLCGLISKDIDPDDRMCTVGDDAGSITFDLDGNPAKPLGSPKGLRKSEYKTVEYGEAVTYYLS